MTVLKQSGVRKALTATAILGVGTLALTSCAGSAAGNDDGPTTITFSYLWGGAEAEAIEGIIADFNESQDDIIVEGVSSPDFQKQLTSMSASKGSFDISDHFGNGVGAWAAKGILAPLDEYLEAEGVDTSDFVPAALDQMTYDGQLYSVPIAVHSFQLLYNKTLLDEAGVEVPTTMDELADAIEALTKQEADGTITQLGLGDPSPSTTLTTLAYNFGGDWDAGGEPSPTEEGNIEALTWYQENITKKFGADNIATFNSGLGEYMSAEDPFYVGKTAMVIDGEWRAVNIPSVAPDLDWGVTSIPYADESQAETTQLTASTLFIPANAQHKDEAAKFLAYLVSDEGMTDFVVALGNLPARTSLLDSDAFADIPNFSVWMDALKSDNVYALSSAPYAAEYSTDLGKAFDEVIRDAASPADALQAVADRASGYATQ
jgi:multiple sugar transport system substrate-binding protein